MHRVAVIGSGTLDTLPHNGAVVTLLVICGCTHRESHFDIVIISIVGPIVALSAVIALGSVAGSFWSRDTAFDDALLDQEAHLPRSGAREAKGTDFKSGRGGALPGPEAR
jgi:hypothetical protein